MKKMCTFVFDLNQNHDNVLNSITHLKMKTKKIGLYCSISAVSLLLITACAKTNRQNELPTIDLEGAVTSEVPDRLVVSDVTFTPLDTATEALLKRGQIVAIDDDRLFVDDDLRRAVVFDKNSGGLMSVMDHKGEGPGEYTWILATGVDPVNDNVTFVCANRGTAGRYSYSDSLITAFSNVPDQRVRSGGRLPIYSMANGYINTEDYEGDLYIDRFDTDFNRIDSIIIPDYKLGWLAGIFGEAGDKAILSIADTIFEIAPEGLRPWLYTRTGDKLMTPAVEKSVVEMARGGKFPESQDLQAQYILPNLVGYGDNILVLSLFHNKNSTIAFFDTTDGTTLKNFACDYSKGISGYPVEWQGHTLYINNLYYNDGYWYAIIPEDNLPDSEESFDANSGLLRFKLSVDK